jgi:HK97 family phage portal protein
MPGSYVYVQPASPAGSVMPGGYGPTLILVEPGGGQVKLTDQDENLRAMPYADVHASQPAIASAVGAAVRRLALLPRKVYRKPAKGKSQNGRPMRPEHDVDNSLHDLLERPAPGFSRMSLTEWQALSLYVNGNSLLVKFRGDDADQEPQEVFPLDWRYAQAWARIGTPVVMWGTVQTGNWVSIAPSEVVHTAWASVAGPQGAWLGTSPLGQLGVTIKIDEAAQAFAAARFNNQIRPGGVASLSPEVDVRNVDNITTRVKAALDDAYKGTDKAFKNVVLAGGTTLAPWPSSSDEAQLVNTRQYDRGEVFEVIGLPANAASPSTPEDDALTWKALMPTAAMMDDRLNAQLVYPEPAWNGLFVKTDFDEALYGDPLVLSDKMAAEFDVGLRTLDEARHPLGLNPVPGRGGKFADEILAEDEPAPTIGPDGKPAPQQPLDQQLTQNARLVETAERL